MQSLELTELIDSKQAKKRLRKRARLHRAQKRSHTGIIRMFLAVLLLLSGYGLYFLKLLPGIEVVEQAYETSVGYAQKTFNEVSFRAGFQIQDISISGLKNLSEKKVLTALGFGAGVSSLNYDSQKAWKRLRDLKWVKSAKVQLLLPGTLLIQIEEYKPFARIQEFGLHYLINEKSEILKYHEVGDYRSLPLFVGYGARQTSPVLFQKMAGFPDLKRKIAAYIKIDNRRWDLLTKSGLKIMLPEKAADKALVKLVALEKKYNILDLGYEKIDLRLNDRIRFGPPKVKKLTVSSL